MILKTDNFYHH